MKPHTEVCHALCTATNHSVNSFVENLFLSPRVCVLRNRAYSRNRLLLYMVNSLPPSLCLCIQFLFFLLLSFIIPLFCVAVFLLLHLCSFLFLFFVLAFHPCSCLPFCPMVSFFCLPPCLSYLFILSLSLYFCHSFFFFF